MLGIIWPLWFNFHHHELTNIYHSDLWESYSHARTYTSAGVHATMSACPRSILGPIFAHRWKEKPRLSRRELRHFWMRTSVCSCSPMFSVHFSCNSVYLPKYESAKPRTPSCSSGLGIGLRLKHFRSVVTLMLSVKAGKETFFKKCPFPPLFWSQF